MAKQVPFSKIKPGKFFRIPGGKTLYQRRKDAEDSSQIVSGMDIGKIHVPCVLVIPVNAKIVEVK